MTAAPCLCSTSSFSPYRSSSVGVSEWMAISAYCCCTAEYCSYRSCSGAPASCNTEGRELWVAGAVTMRSQR